ncbi:MAG TPA: FG-GAP-like repeat-containing protein [Polyangiaceae bacterium]|nr:FG-GAP-like repeat-containing protein [Polyangiaceae bacterium]
MQGRPGSLRMPPVLWALLCVAWLPSCSGGSNGGNSSGTGGQSAQGGRAASSGGSTSGGANGVSSGGAAQGDQTGSGGTSAASAGGIPSAGSAAITGGAPNGGATLGAGRGGSGDSGAAAGGRANTGGQGGASHSDAFPTFTKHTIASFSSGYATVAVDVDHDGLLDVVALSSGSAGLVWFKNPSWKKYTITTKAKQLIYSAPHDIDGDGHVDLAFISDFDMNNSKSGGTISWAEAPDDPTQSQDWALHPIDAVPTSHRLRWADIDGDGKKELIVLPIFGIGSTQPTRAGAVQLKAYAVPQDPKGAWTGKVLDDTHLEVAHGIEIVDWDGDKAEDILTAANDGIDLFRPSLGSAPQHIGAGKEGQPPDRGSSEVGLGTLGGMRFIASIEFWHGTDAVVYTPGASATELWTRQVLGTDFEHGHGLMVADFDGDGYDEIVAGGGQGDMAEIIYRYAPSTKTWQKIPLDTGSVAVSEIDVKDIDGDGALDIVAIGGSPTNNVVWYENSR